MKSPEAVAPLMTVQIGMTASPVHASGTDRYYLDLLRHLPAQGVVSRGMVLGEPAAIERPVDGVGAFAAEHSGRVARWRGARRTFRSIVAGAKLVVSHGQPHAFPILDLIGERPLVVQFHGPWALEAQQAGSNALVVAIRRFQERSVYRRAVRLIALSRAFADVLVKSYGVDEASIRIVPGGVDLERFGTSMPVAEARAKSGLPADRPIVLAARRLVPSKGIADLIDAMVRVRAEIPDVLCAITGTGDLRADLERRAADAGLDDSVRFVGHVSDADLAVLYRAVDLSVVPSVAWEGFGLSVLEALASGTPAIVTSVGGLPEAIGDLDPTLVVPPNDPVALAARIVSALRGDVPSEEACVAYAGRFSWPSIARRVADVYREVATS